MVLAAAVWVAPVAVLLTAVGVLDTAEGVTTSDEVPAVLVPAPVPVPVPAPVPDPVSEFVESWSSTAQARAASEEAALIFKTADEPGTATR